MLVRPPPACPVRGPRGRPGRRPGARPRGRRLRASRPRVSRARSRGRTCRSRPMRRRRCAPGGAAAARAGARRCAGAAAAPPAAARAGAAREHDAIAVTQGRGSGGDHGVAVGEAAEDLHEVLLLGAEVEGAEDGRLVERREHATAAAQVHDRGRGHDERLLARAGGDAHARVHPRLQARRRVGNLDLDWRGAGGRVEHRRHAGDAAREHFAGEGVHVDAGGVSSPQLGEVLLDDVGHQTDGGDVHDVQHRHVLRHEGAGIDRAARDVAGDGGTDDGVAEVDAQLVEAGLRLEALGAREVDRRLRRLVARLVVVERLLRQQLPLEQVARAFGVGLRQPRGRLRAAGWSRPTPAARLPPA